MKRIISYNQFIESRPIKEEFLDKFWRNLTGRTKKRIESVTRQIELFKDSITPLKITDLPYPLKESDDELVKEVLDNFTKIVETGEWRKELADSLEYLKSYRSRSDLIQMLIDYIKGNPDFSKVEDITDMEFAYMKFSDSDIRDIKLRIKSSKGDIAKSTLLKALAKVGNKEEFQNAKFKEEDTENKEPETKLLKYYDDIFSYMDRNSKPKTEFNIDEIGSFGSDSSNNIAKLMKSFIAFQGKPYKSYDYDKSKPEAFESTLGKDYIQKIDFSKKISELENLKLLKEELERVISWSNKINSEKQSSQKSIDKLDTLKEIFSFYYNESDILKIKSKGQLLQTSPNESLLNLINYILNNYGDMTIKEFFDFYNSKVNKNYTERFTTSEDYVNSREVYKIKEGCGKVYHGGKISPTDLDFLFREQGGMFAAKLMTGANNWPTILGTREGGLLSIQITKRVYELSIKPGVKMVDYNPGGADKGNKGGLKDERELYTRYDVKGMANKWYMNTPDGQVPDNLPMRSREVPITKEEYVESALQSEVVVLDRSVCDIRIVPYKELISEYERLGNTNQIYKKLKDNYPKIRNCVWELESSSPGILSKLKEFTKLDNLDEIKKSIIKSKSGKLLTEAPGDQKVDDLLEKCGTISIKEEDIKKFPTLLDYIIFKFAPEFRL